MSGQTKSELRGRLLVPWPIRALARWLAPAHYREAIEGDLAELFHGRAADRGFLRAWLRSLGDALSLLRASSAMRQSIVPEPNGRRKGDGIMRNLWQDVRYSLRLLRRSPGFTVVAVLTLALGIGANTAIFSVIHAVLLSPLPFPEPHRLALIWETNLKKGWDQFSVAPANFLDWRQQNHSFESMAAVRTRPMSMTGAGAAEQVQVSRVSADLFPLLGVPPLMGRLFFPEEDAPERNRVLLLSYGMWQQQFGADPGIIGRHVFLERNDFTIVGVMPRQFAFPSPRTQVWAPMAFDFDEQQNRGGHDLLVVARLKEGVTLDAAQTDMAELARRLEQAYPAINLNWGTKVELMHEAIVQGIRPALLVLLGAVGFVLLIACANLANLLLSRATSRGREIALRAALGAARGRLVSQLITESVLLAMLGGVVGCLLAYGLVRVLPAISAGSIPRVQFVSINAPVLGFTLGLCVLTGLLFGLLPALRVAGTNPSESLKEGGRGSGTRAGQRLRNLLVVAEMAFALVLLVGAGLLLRSFARLADVNPGFDPSRVLVFSMGLPRAGYDDARVFATYRQLTEKLKALPGVEAAGGVQVLPMDGDWYHGYSIAGGPPMSPNDMPSAAYRAITPDYFRTLSIPLIRGRGFTEADSPSTPPVAVVDQTFVRLNFPNSDPLGQHMGITNGRNFSYEIVGVVGEVKLDGLAGDSFPTVYVSAFQVPYRGMTLALRAQSDPMVLAGAARSEVQGLDPDLPIFRVRSLEQVVATSVADRRFTLFLGLLFAGLAAALAAVGIYGVMAYSVSQRTREIGVRMALGAQRGDVFRLILRQGMLLAILGVTFGLGGALGMTQFVRRLLFGVEPTDLMTYGAVTAGLLLVALLACYIPARRATRVDPLVALRYE